MPSSKAPRLFILAIWTLVIAGGFSLVVLPLLQNTWALHHWTPTPCRILARGGYMFEYNGQTYIATRRDFWDNDNSPFSKVPTPTDPNYDITCFVGPGTPSSTVLALDTYKRWDLALKPIFLTAFLIVAAALITWKVRRRPQRRRNC